MTSDSALCVNCIAEHISKIVYQTCDKKIEQNMQELSVFQSCKYM